MPVLVDAPPVDVALRVDLVRRTEVASQQLARIVEALEADDCGEDLRFRILLLAERIRHLTTRVHHEVIMDTLRAQRALTSVAHDGKNLGYFEVNWDFGDQWVSTDQNKFAKIPALMPGLHTVYVRACNGPASCSDPESLQFQIIAITPNKVTNLRLTRTATNTATPATAKVPAKPAAKRP